MTSPDDQKSPLSAGLVFLFALAVGVSVANLYYIQPLLATIRHEFGISSAVAALAITFTQVGYAIGLVFVLPLGDLFERRRLVGIVCIGVTAALVLAASAPDYPVLLIGLALVGLTSVVAHLLIPYAATLARPEERGAILGKVMSGLLIGILSARTFSGLVAGATSWRVVFAIAAGAMALIALALKARLPRYEPVNHDMHYVALVGSLWTILTHEPLVLRRSLYGMCSMGAFSVLWTTIAFLLAGSPYHYSSSKIGLFGLVGLAGTVMANVAGRMADKQRSPQVTWFSAACLASSFVAIAFGRHSLVALLIGIIVLDLGAQGMQITNQSQIYTLSAEARTRMNAVYMAMFFVGATVSSALAGAIYQLDGWYAVCALGGGIGAASLIAATLGLVLARRRGREAVLQPPATAGTMERV